MAMRIAANVTRRANGSTRKPALGATMTWAPKYGSRRVYTGASIAARIAADATLSISEGTRDWSGGRAALRSVSTTANQGGHSRVLTSRLDAPTVTIAAIGVATLRFSD